MPSYKVLMIAPTSFFSDTGCHVRILEEARALRQRGHAVSICTYRKGRDIDGFPIYRTWPLPWRQHYVVGSSRHKLAYDTLLLPKVLERALADRPHVIHAHLHEGALIGSIIGRVLRIPVVFDFQGSASSEMVDHHFLNPQGFWYRPMLWLERQINKLPQALITSSATGAVLLRERFHCPPGRITVIQDRASAVTFRPDIIAPEERDTLRQQLSIAPQSKVIVYLGLLAEHQGTSLLLRAATHVVRAMPEVHFLIMGYPGVEGYREYANLLGISNNVVFTGQMPYEDAARYLALGDIAVSPKLSETEGAGKLLNYMAMALPTVAFATPVNREYLGDLGIYAPSVDEGALAGTLAYALQNLEALRATGEALRQQVIERFSWDEGALLLESVYQRVIGD